MKLLTTSQFFLLLTLFACFTGVSSNVFHKEEQSVFSYDNVHKILDKVQIAHQQVYDGAGKVKDDVFKSWSDSDLKSWLKAHNLDLPDTADARAVAVKHKDLLSDDIKYYTDKAADSASPYLSKSKEQLAQAGHYLFDTSVETWSDSRLKDFLDSRDIKLPSTPSRKELIKLAKKNKNKALNTAKHGKWSFDNWSLEDLTNWFKEQGHEAKGTRDQLVALAGDKIGDAKDYISDVSSSANKKYTKAKKASFNKWSESDLSAYLESYGIKTKPASKKDELVALAKNQYELFVYGKKQTTFDKAVGYLQSGVFHLFLYVKLFWVKVYSFLYGLVFNARLKTEL